MMRNRTGLMFFVLGFFLFWVNGDNYAAAPVLVRMAADFGIGIREAAVTVTAYMACFGLFTVFFGPAGDRFGRPVVLKIAAAGSAAASIASAFVPGLTAVTIVRAFNGAFSAGVMPVTMAFIGETSTDATRQGRIGAAMGLMMLGGALATCIGGVLSQWGSWRLVYLVYGAAETVLLVPLFLLLPRGGGEAGASVPRVPFTGLAAPYRTVFATPGFLRTVGLLFFVGFSTMGTFPYLGKYLQNRSGLGLPAVGMLLGAYGIGTLSGGNTAGILKRRWGRRFFLLSGVSGGAGFLVFGEWTAWPVFAAAGLFLAGFAFVCLQSSIISSAQDLSPSRRGTVMSAASFTMVMSGAIGTFVNGRLFAVNPALLPVVAASGLPAAGILASILLVTTGKARAPVAAGGEPVDR